MSAPDDGDHPGDGDAVTAPVGIAAMVSDVVAVQLSEAGQGASLERLAELEAKIAGAVRASRAASTLTAYRTDWADFTLWCDSNGLDSMPAAPATVAAYLVELGEHKDDRKPRAISTIQRRKAAISEAHKLAGETSPCLDPLVKQVTKGLRRQLGVATTRRKAGLSTADVRAIVGGLDSTRLIDVRDRAPPTWFRHRHAPTAAGPSIPAVRRHHGLPVRPGRAAAMGRRTRPTPGPDQAKSILG